jgi:L-asparaginase
MKTWLPVFLCFAFTYPAKAQNLPRIIVLATGGTIAGQQPNADKAGYLAAKIPIADLLKNIPAITAKANVQGEQVASIGSYDMSVDIWLKLSRRINEIFANNEADAVVITHGTDTQEETAYFLSLTVPANKPVVLTGSMRPATAMSSDGAKNLYDAILVAANSNSKGKGVLLCFNEAIYDAKNVVKTNTTSVNAFSSPNSGAIGHVYDGNIFYNSLAVQQGGDMPVFDISKLAFLPAVEIVYAYAGASDAAINAFISNKAEGIIIAGTGNGSFDKAIVAAVKEGVKKGIIIVRSSRVITGRVTTQYVGAFDDSKLGTIVSDELNPQKARILLMLALTISKDKTKIQKMFFKL